MHTYSIDTEERKTIIFFIAFFSMMLNSGFLCIINQYSSLEFIKVPSPFVIFGVLYLLFDKIIWKWKICSLFVKTPNLNGEWEGQYVSSHTCETDLEPHNTIVPAKLEIKQTWTKIEIISRHPNSKSNSSMASIFTKGGGENSLKFEYNNDSNTCVQDLRPSHSGFTNLVYNSKDKTMKGYYYTDRNRQNFGSADFQFADKSK